MRRLFFFAAALVLGLSPLAACGADHAPAATAPAPEAGVDAPIEATEAGGFPILPYPAGPYGVAMGDVMPDLTIQGYPLSRTERDPSKLPFRNIRLSEVRSDPACTCMVLVYNVAGSGCGFCVDLDATVAEIVARDQTICAAEIVAFSFDTLDPDGGEPFPPPPTRADLDAVVTASRPSFPVGLATTSAHEWGLDVIPAFPDFFVMHPGDMRIRAFEGGSGDIEKRLRDACATPWPPVETIATGFVGPRHIVKDDAFVYLSDGGKVLRLPSTGGAPEVFAAPPSAPDALAIDGTHVYWATHDGGGSFEIGRAPKAGGAREVLASGTSGYTSLGLDDASVWFTRDDGVIAHVPKAGGAEVPLATEPGASSVAVDDTTVYVIAGTEVIARPKDGGARKVIATPTDLSAIDAPRSEPTEVWVTGSEIFVHGRRPPYQSVLVSFSKATGSKQSFATWPITAVAVSPDGQIYYGQNDPNGHGAVNHWDTGANNPALFDHRLVLTLGQHRVTSLLHDGTYAYWTDAFDGGVALRRIGSP